MISRLNLLQPPSTQLGIKLNLLQPPSTRLSIKLNLGQIRAQLALLLLQS